MIDLKDDITVVDDRRTAVPPDNVEGAVFDGKILVPDEIPVDTKRYELAGAEQREDTFAVVTFPR